MPTMRSIRWWIGVFVLACTAAAVAQPVTVVEYYHPALDHYFMTSLQVEVDALDSGLFFGWSRTGWTFQAFADSASGGPGVNPVCRFYIPPPSDSHFFSAAADECAAVLAKIPTDPNFRSFVYETPSAFYSPPAATVKHPLACCTRAPKSSRWSRSTRRILSISLASGSRIDGRAAAQPGSSQGCRSMADAHDRARRRRCRAVPGVAWPMAAITHA